MKKKKRKIIITYVLVPVVVFLLCEIIARQFASRWEKWYAKAELIAQKEKINFIFIDSSRVAAAVDEISFENTILKETGKKVRALNLGQGHSTFLQHSLGIRNLYKVAPQNMKNCKVFVEAPGGMPQELYKKRWLTESIPELLLYVLKDEDIIPFIKSDVKTKIKFKILFKYYTRVTRIFSESAFLRHEIIKEGNKLTKKILSLFFVGESISAKVDLAQRGGIRIDREGIKLVKKRVLEDTNEAIKNQKLLSSWQFGKNREFKDFFGNRDLRIVYFFMPLTSGGMRQWLTPIGKKNIFLRRKLIYNYGILYLPVNFQYTDADFPDDCHLSRTKAKLFSANLAKAWLSLVKSK